MSAITTAFTFLYGKGDLLPRSSKHSIIIFMLLVIFFFRVNFTFIRIEKLNFLQTSRHLDDWNRLLQKDVDVTSQANRQMPVHYSEGERQNLIRAAHTHTHTHTHIHTKKRKVGTRGAGQIIFSPSSSLTPVLCVYLTRRGDVYIGSVKHRQALIAFVNNK